MAAFAVIIMAGCSKASDSNHEEHKGEEHGDEIVLKNEQISKLGIKSSTLVPSEFQEIIKCGGEILPSTGSQVVVAAKSSGIVQLSTKISLGVQVGRGETICSISSDGLSGGDPRSEANVRLSAAKQEYERVYKLYKSNLATEKELQDAKLAVEIASNSVNGNAKSSVATCSISGVVTQLLVSSGTFVNIGDPIAVVRSSNKLTLRAYVSQRYCQDIALVESANFKLPDANKTFELSAMQGRRLTAQTMSNASNGYIPVDFSFANDGTIPAGCAAEVYLLGAKTDKVLAVPTESVIEEQGKYFVFVREAKEHFEKRPVVIGRTDGKRIEIKSGVSSGEEIVTEGTIYVKLAANSGVVPEGHHHH